MDMSMQNPIKRAGTAQKWLLANPVLGENEVGIETDTHLIMVGDQGAMHKRIPHP
jgi:hypothetical protein